MRRGCLRGKLWEGPRYYPHSRVSGPFVWLPKSMSRISKSITPEFQQALAETELRAYYRDDASVQPGNLQDVLLHETAVA